jgi:hypothetical protein
VIEISRKRKKIDFKEWPPCSEFPRTVLLSIVKLPLHACIPPTIAMLVSPPWGLGCENTQPQKKFF